MRIPKRILLIEDDEDDQFFFIAALNEIDNTVLQHLARNGKEALDYLSGCQVLPDFIFTDINMPLMNGIECLKGIIENPTTSNIPVVVLSTDTGRGQLALLLGASAFIEKPSDNKILRKKIEQHISMSTCGGTHGYCLS